MKDAQPKTLIETKNVGNIVSQSVGCEPLRSAARESLGARAVRGNRGFARARDRGDARHVADVAVKDNFEEECFEDDLIFKIEDVEM